MLCRSIFLVLAFSLPLGLTTVVLPSPVEAQFGTSVLRSQSRNLGQAISRSLREAFRPSLQVRQGATSPVVHASLSADETMIAKAYADGTVRLWDLAAGRETTRFATGERLRQVWFGGAGLRVVTLSDTGARVFGLRSGRLYRLSEQPGATHLAVTPDGETAFLRFGDGRVAALATASGDLRQSPAPLPAGERTFAMAVAGRHLALVDDGGRIALIDPQSLTPAATAEIGGEPRLLAVDTETGGFFLLDAGSRLWHWPAGVAEPQQLFTLQGLGGQASALAVDERRGRVALGTSVGDIGVWDLQGRSLQRMGLERTRITGLILGRGGSELLSTADDGFLHLWAAETGDLVVSILSTNQGWAVIDGFGRFDGDPETLYADLAWADGRRSLPVANFSDAYYAPGLLDRVRRSDAGLQQVPRVTEGIGMPPEVQLRLQGGGDQTGGGQVGGVRTARLDVEASDQGGGIDEVRLYHNGRAVGDRFLLEVEQRSDGVLRRHEIPLQPGENRFAAVAISDDGVEGWESRAEISVRGGDPLPARLHLIAIGINQYRLTQLNLDYAHADAVSMAEFFRSEGRPVAATVETRQILDGEATREAVLQSIRALRDASPHDIVLVYAAGHGISIGDGWYFLPTDLDRIDAAAIRSQGLSVDDFRRELADIAPQRVAVIIDACESGLAASELGRYEGLRRLRLLARSTGIHVIAATDRSQNAYELPHLGHGALTYSVLEALRGDTGSSGETVQLSDVFRHVERAVPLLTEQYLGQPQYPTIHSLGADFPLVYRRPAG